MAEGADEVKKNLHEWADRQRAAVITLANNWAGQLEGRAKTTAPWTDRTGNARNGLFGGVEVKGTEVFIRLGHSMEYGIFLELANDGRFAVLKPIIDQAVPEIYDSYKRLWE